MEQYITDYINNLSFWIILLFILAFVLEILNLIAWCKLFVKANVPWERLFVPCYGNYWQYKVADCANFFWGVIGLSVISTLLSLLIGGVWSTIVSMIAGLGFLGIFIVFMISLARAYGKEDVFAVGLILLYPVFIMILAFGKSEYVGSYSGKIPPIQATATWDCPACGTANSASRVSCEKCGCNR